MSGTSMATPIVAGQAALIKSNWNFLTAPDMAQIIFQSATHLCSDNASAAVCKARTTADAMYGWGLVNVGASLQPIGTLNLTSKTGAVINLAGASLASAKSGKVAGLPTLTTLGVDKFNRGFVVNIGTAVASAGSTTAALPVVAATTTAAGGVKLSAQYTQVVSQQTAMGLANQDNELTLGKVSYSFANEQGSGWGFGTGGTSGAFFGLQSTGFAPLSLSGEGSRFNAPYLALADQAQHVGYAMTLKNGDVLRWGAVVQDTAAQTSLLGAGNAPVSMQLATVELQKTFGTTTTVMTLGQMQESDAVMGMRGTGALAIGAQSSTTFMTLAAAKTIAPKTQLSAMVSVGSTAAYSNQSASLIDGASASQTAAWSMGLARSDVLRSGDSLGLTVSMPLRTMTGSMQVTTASTQNQEDGALGYTTQSLSLSPSGVEKDIELAYARPSVFGGKLSGMAVVKLEPGHDAQAPAQYGLGMRYQKAF
jgi:hypothetical protein